MLSPAAPPRVHGGWQPISTAEHVRFDTRAELRMQNGRVYRAVWQFRGRGCAWWMEPGQARKAPAGLYDPIEWRVIATGLTEDADWRKAAAVGRAHYATA